MIISSRMGKSGMINEALLDAWLNLSANLWNERIVSSMPFNEAFVCNLLYKQYLAHPEAPYLTAKQLCEKTKILKSHMNKTLNSLEKKQLIERKRLDGDKRLVHISLVESNKHLFLEEHSKNLLIVDQIIDELGEERARETVDVLIDITKALQALRAREANAEE